MNVLALSSAPVAGWECVFDRGVFAVLAWRGTMAEAVAVFDALSAAGRWFEMRWPIGVWNGSPGEPPAEIMAAARAYVSQ